ncbi:hypothetical protein A1O7_08493 [Cladophialophora yegresii CBS 114405]|uniref:Uncharacterized protein n=1 Tax=Cladophialophora yegresii CBS 114405 TaxID=1182544 RepID=W9VRC0_9EURO|nr:uncharacterized protein A1O7_08493 [Cladophialophora yegresii CBS 114405]EXJ55565.1 hypothetical protein A1O7_08493 [Cladophialophora yegresii CBS 114405]
MQTAATDPFLLDIPDVPVVAMPPSETSSVTMPEVASRRSDSELSSLVFEAQQDFDAEAYFKQHFEEEQRKEVAKDQAQRQKVDFERKVQRQVWLDGLDYEQWDNMTRNHLPYHETGEVNVDDMKAGKEAAGLLYAQGFYWPTETNRNEETPSALIPLRDLKRFPLPRVECRDSPPEYTDWTRGQQVLVRHDSHKKIQFEDPVTREVQFVQTFGSAPWNSYKYFNNEELRSLKCAHHINFFGRAVPHQSGTRPATTIAILKSKPKNLNVTTPDGLWKSAVMECATQMLDPILYHGTPEVLDTLRGTDLEDACIGHAEIIYSSLGWWDQDTYPDGQCPADSDALVPSSWPKGSIVMNGVSEGFASRLEIMTSSTEEKKSDDIARKAAFQGRVARGRVKSRLGVRCWTHRHTTQEMVFVARARTGLLTPSFASSKYSTTVTSSATEHTPKSTTSNVDIASSSCTPVLATPTEHTPHPTTSNVDIASSLSRAPVLVTPTDRPAPVFVRPARHVSVVVKSREEFNAQIHAFDVANGLPFSEKWEDDNEANIDEANDEDDDNEEGKETTETKSWRQRMRDEELKDGLGPVSEKWDDEFEPEHAAAPTTQQSAPEDAASQLADTQAVVAEVTTSELDRKLCEHDALTGFQPASKVWADDVDEDETLASSSSSGEVEMLIAVDSAMVVMSHMPNTIATALANLENPVEADVASNVERGVEADLLAKVQSCARGQSAAIEAQVSVKVSLPAIVVEDVDSNGHRRVVSASSADSTTNISTPQTSPELEAEDDINIIYDNAENDGCNQPSLSKVLEPSDTGYVDDMDLDEEHELQHGEPFVLTSVQLTGDKVRGALDSPVAPSAPFSPAGLVAFHRDVVRIPGLGLVNEDDVSYTPPATTSLKLQSSAMVAWMSAEHPDLIIARHLQVVASAIPAMVPNMVLPGLHTFGNGASTSILPRQRIGLVHSPLMTFDPEDYIPNRVIEEIVDDEEEVDGTVVNENISSLHDIHLSTLVLYNTALESTTEDESHTSSSEASLSTPPTSAGSSTSDGRRSRHVHFDLLESRKSSLATTASASSSMATLCEIGACFPPSTFDQWPGFDNDRHPEIPEHTSSLTSSREHGVAETCSSSKVSRKRDTFANVEDGAEILTPRPDLPTFRRTRCDWQHASWSSIGRKLTKSRPATVTTTKVATTVRSRDGVMTRANSNESQFFEFPESRRVSNENGASRTGQKTKGFFKKGTEKVKKLLLREN